LIAVRRFQSFAELQPLRAELAAVHSHSRRSCPFSTLEYLQAFYEHDEFHPPGDGSELWWLVAGEGDRVLAYLPLRSVEERIFGLPARKLEFLATHDTDRPHLVASAAEEQRCAAAFYEYLMTHKKAWSFLELRQQDRDSKLFPVPVDASRYYVRLFDAPQNSTVRVGWPSTRDYFASLKKKARSNTSRQLRNLLTSGEVLYLSSEHPAALPTLFELYLQVEARSWKAQAEGTIGRHPARVAFFRRLLEPDQPMRLCISLLLLDGVPIAGLVDGRFGQGLFALQIAFDESRAKLSPGATVLFMSLRRAIEDRLAFYNLLSGFAYYKSFWHAETVDTQTVQLIRRGSRHYWKALAGDLIRRVLGTDQERIARFNLVKSGGLRYNPFRKDALSSGDAPASAPLDSRKAIDAQVVAGLLSRLPATGVNRYDAGDLAALLPFDVQRGGQS
jgi:CelD/BcsL family acetyltransferase involved in cellulose biosynthesis